MTQKIRRKRPAKRKRSRYTVGEWFMVLLGAAILVLVLGIVITTLLG